MVTRLYLPSSGSAEMSPAFSTTWETTSGMARRPCAIAKINTSMLTTSITYSGTNDDTDIGYFQFVSQKLDAQTISGTIKFCLAASELDAASNLFVTVIVRVIQSNGTTFRGTLLGSTRYGTEVHPTTSSNIVSRYSGALSLSSLAVSAGDRLVIEIGLGREGTSSGGHPPTPLTYTGRLGTGDTSVISDMAASDGSSDVAVPWVEFSGNLLFLANIDSAVATATGRSPMAELYQDPSGTFRAVVSTATASSPQASIGRPSPLAAVVTSATARGPAASILPFDFRHGVTGYGLLVEPLSGPLVLD